MQKTEEEKLKKKLKLNTFIIVMLLLILLVILCVVLVKVFSVKDGVNNNDSNMGMVTKNDDVIFYYDYNKGLVKKSKDNKEVTLTDSQAYSINYYDGYIYFTTPNSTGGIDIKKITSDGKNEQILLSTTSSSTKMYIQGSKIYYLTSNPDTISKMDLDGNNTEVLLQRGIVDFKVIDEKIYFSDIMGYLYSIDLNGKNYKTLINESLFEEFQMLDENVYYFDNENNKLMKINLKEPSKKYEVTDKLDCDIYNVTTNGVYYLNKDDFKIAFVSANGKNERNVVDINTNNTKINIVENVLYYLDSNSGKTITKEIKTNGKKVK